MNRKNIIYTVALFAAVAGAICAQEFGQSHQQEFIRNVKLNAARTDQVNALWEIIDSKKPNSTLIRVTLTRSGTNDVNITVQESLRVKIVED